jgi:Family of unknown function (DUF6338)
VIPSTLLGLVLLAASIGPGYLWVRVAETRVPRSPRTQLLEVAELIIIGGLASTLSFLLVFWVASRYSWIDSDALAADGTAYVLRHPAPGFGVIFVGLVLAYVGAWLAARVRYIKRPAIITHGYSAWHRILSKEREVAVYATVDLRDGTTVAGWVQLCTVDEVPPAERDLVLIANYGKRLRIAPPNADGFFESDDQAVILNGADVSTITASYFSRSEKDEEQRRRFA